MHKLFSIDDQVMELTRLLNLDFGGSIFTPEDVRPIVVAQLHHRIRVLCYWCDPSIKYIVPAITELKIMQDIQKRIDILEVVRPRSTHVTQLIQNEYDLFSDRTNQILDVIDDQVDGSATEFINQCIPKRTWDIMTLDSYYKDFILVNRGDFRINAWKQDLLNDPKAPKHLVHAATLADKLPKKSPRMADFIPAKFAYTPNVMRNIEQRLRVISLLDLGLNGFRRATKPSPYTYSSVEMTIDALHHNQARRDFFERTDSDYRFTRDDQ